MSRIIGNWVRLGLRRKWLSLAVVLLAVGLGQKVWATCTVWFTANDVIFVGGETDENAWFFEYCQVVNANTSAYEAVSSYNWTSLVQSEEILKNWKCITPTETYAYTGATCSWTPTPPPYAPASCASTCATCNGTASNDCLTCPSGQWLTEGVSPGTCGTTCDPSCETCNGAFNTNCETCPSGTWLSGAAPNTCANTCASSCLTCDGPASNNCTSCVSGEWPTNGVCGNVCAATCNTCDGPGSSQCTSCPTGTWLTSGACGQVCSYQCNTCNGASTSSCLTCPSGYWLAGAAPNSCVQTCDPSCATCNGPGSTQCLTCPSGSWLLSTGQCSSACDPSCTTCSGPLATECTSCPTGSWVGSDGECGQVCDPSCASCSGSTSSNCTSCTAGEWLTDGACGNVCDPSCASCSGPTSSNCTSCNSGAWLTGGACGNVCDPSCASCSGPTSSNCTSCTSGAWLTGGACGNVCDPTCSTCESASSAACLTCPSGSWLAGDAPNACVQSCDPSCATCSGPSNTDCLSCASGTWLSANGMCGDVCDPSCSTCSGPSNTQCLSCASGSWLNADGECGQTCDATCSTCDGPNNTECLTCPAGAWLPASASSEIPSVVATIYLTPFYRAQCGVSTSAYTPEGTVTTVAQPDGSVKVTFVTIGGQPGATYIAAETCVQFLGTYTTDPTGYGTGTFVIPSAEGQTQAFDTQQTLDGTGNGIVYYTSAQTSPFQLPTGTGDGPCTTTCDPSCSTCNGPQATQCTACPSGEWVTNGACGQVCNPSCATCSGPSSSQCTSCTSGSWVTGGACGQACDASCDSCSGPSSTQCTSCAPGSWLTGGACGNVCNSSCASCSGPSSTQCTSCASGEWLTGGACGNVCNSSCASCSGPSSTQCTSCAPGSWLTGGACGTVCDSSCASCSGPSASQCTSCGPSTWLTGTSCGNVCDASCASCSGPSPLQCTSCPASEWLTGGACGNVCDSSCASCSGPSSTQCTSCPSGEWLTGGACGTVCDASCASCSGPSASQCTSCGSSTWLTGTTCGNVCDASCATCSGPGSSQCSSCSTGEWLTGGACGNVCDSSCATCSGPNSSQCTSCASGEWLTGGACGQVCDFSCVTCSGPSSSQCSTCPTGEWLTGGACGNICAAPALVLQGGSSVSGPPALSPLVDDSLSVLYDQVATLDASGSTSTVGTVWQWVEVDGNPVPLTLSSANTPTLSFVTPTLGATVSYQLKLIASTTPATTVCSNSVESSVVITVVVIPPTPTPCVLSAWSAYGACSASCGGGTQTSTQTIIAQPTYGGTACPSVLTQTQACNTAPCSPCLTGNGGCSQICTDVSGVAQCSCETGYTLGSNETSCYLHPAVSAGAAQSFCASPGESYALTGTATDPNSPALPMAYLWTEQDSPDVATLKGATGLSASFTAPAFTGTNETLHFALTATDSAGLSGTATTQVTLWPAATSPVPVLGGGSGSDSSPTLAPLAGDKLAVLSSQEVVLTAAQAANTTYQWQQVLANSSGPLTLTGANTATLSFESPAAETDDTAGSLSYQFKLIATATPPAGSACMATASSTTVVTVVVDEPPVAQAAEASTSVCGGQTITLEGNGSTDPNGSSLTTYTWTQLANPALSAPIGPLSGESASFTAPTLSAATTLTFVLEVTDALGLQSINTNNTVSVAVKDVNQAPLADAGASQTVIAGASVTLNGAGSFDPDADPLTYSWKQTGGPSVCLSTSTSSCACGSTSALDAPTFTAPIAALCGSGVTLTFELTVTDQPSSSQCGGPLSSSATVTVTVEPLDHEPIAFAGFPETVNDGSVVELDGSLSFDPDGDRLTYLWTQLSGPTATLSSNTAVTPTFTAPTVATGTMSALVFQLTVSDPYGLSASSDVTVTDKGLASPPNCSGAYASIGQAWPPSHELLDVSILGVKDPSDPNVPITILSIQQDEPTTATCPGDTPIDGVNNGDGTCLLRGEHGTSTGNRTYYITFQASDPWGNRCTGEVTVCAPGVSGGSCAGRGPLFDSTR